MVRTQLRFFDQATKSMMMSAIKKVPNDNFRELKAFSLSHNEHTHSSIAAAAMALTSHLERKLKSITYDCCKPHKK
jgi:hypothetical protein